jgi:diphthamide synthase (EF-2-diphthine--ammonia ligase)
MVLLCLLKRIILKEATAVKADAVIALMDTGKKRVTISWSGGKDSAFALYKILSVGTYHVVHLHTVVNAETKRVSMHGVHEKLLMRQAEALGIPLEILYMESSANHDNYTQLMTRFYKRCAGQGIEGVVFGDIFLEDLKIFRESLLQDTGLSSIYPLWEVRYRDAHG